MRFLEKLQSLSERTRKIILWSIIVVLAGSLLFWWFNNLQNKLSNLQGVNPIEGLELPNIEMPQMPDIDQEKLKQALDQLQQDAK